MQDLKYYVLWVKNSPLLKKYFDKYYDKLTSDLKILSEWWVLTEEISKLLETENRDFILNPDQSSIINLLYNEYILDKKQDTIDKSIYINRFKKEINTFLDWDYENLMMNTWPKIPTTEIKLTTKDYNPYNSFEAHPEHHLNWWVLWYWERDEKEWLEVYTKTFEILKKLDEWIYDELNQIIDKIIPLWTARWLHNSASYKECIWHLYMWYTIDTNTPEINILEAIIHESSHNKLNLIMQFDKIVLNDYEEKYYSAIRPDARPIIWVFLWYHAFAPTMYIVMKAYVNWIFWDDKNWYEKIIVYYLKTKFLQRTIKKYAILTELWKEISDEIDFVITKMDWLIREMKPSTEALLKARSIQNQHFEQVNQKYPNLVY